MILLCPLCGDDDDVTRAQLPSGDWQYTCNRSSKWHPDRKAYMWEPTNEVATSPRGAGSPSDRGLADALLACVYPDEPWVEYGIVEHRYSEAHLESFEQLVREKGHVWWSPDGADPASIRTGEPMASRYLVRSLSALHVAGELERRFGPGTGAWHRHSISYWVRPPAPPWARRLTYQKFAARGAA